MPAVTLAVFSSSRTASPPEYQTACRRSSPVSWWKYGRYADLQDGNDDSNLLPPRPSETWGNEYVFSPS